MTASTAVGLAFVDCANAYAFKWTAKGGMKLLPKKSENAAMPRSAPAEPTVARARRARMRYPGNGDVVGGWEEIPERGGLRVGSIWVGNKQTLLRDPSGDNVFGGWVGEVMGVNSAGTIAVGLYAGPPLKDAYKWTPAKGVTSLGRYPGQVCYFDWVTARTSLRGSRNGRLLGLGRRQGRHRRVAPAQRRHRRRRDLHAEDGLDAARRFPAAPGRARGVALAVPRRHVSADGKTLVGTAWPLAADYYQGFRLDLDQVYVCHDKGKNAKTMQVAFPRRDGRSSRGRRHARALPRASAAVSYRARAQSMAGRMI